MALQLTPDERKDRVIQQQLDVIRTLTAGNLSRMSTDFWGPAASPKPPEKAPAGAEKPPAGKADAAASGGAQLVEQTGVVLQRPCAVSGGQLVQQRENQAHHGLVG